jgi:hypothetical protein
MPEKGSKVYISVASNTFVFVGYCTRLRKENNASFRRLWQHSNRTLNPNSHGLTFRWSRSELLYSPLMRLQTNELSEIIGVVGWSYPSAPRVSLMIAAYAAAYSLSAADDTTTSMILLLQHTGPFSCQSFFFLGDTAAAKSSM